MHWVFLQFEDRENYNGVGWGQFAKSVRQHIKTTEFKAKEFGHYEGKVWFDLVGNDNKYLKLNMISRSSFEDARDMSTLKWARLTQVGDLKMFCSDNNGHQKYPSLSVIDMFTHRPPKNLTSIKEITLSYDEIYKRLADYSPQTYIVVHDKVVGLPHWLTVSSSHNNCCGNNNHIVMEIRCKVKNSEVINSAS